METNTYTLKTIIYIATVHWRGTHAEKRTTTNQQLQPN